MDERALDRRVVMAELQKLALYYRDCTVDERTLPLLAEMYYEDVRHLSADQFRQAVSLARSKCRFFPKSVDILEARAELRCAAGAGSPSKPVSNVSAEQAQRSKEHCRGVLQMLRSNRCGSVTEAVRPGQSRRTGTDIHPAGGGR